MIFLFLLWRNKEVEWSWGGGGVWSWLGSNTQCLTPQTSVLFPGLLPPREGDTMTNGLLKLLLGCRGRRTFLNIKWGRASPPCPGSRSAAGRLKPATEQEGQLSPLSGRLEDSTRATFRSSCGVRPSPQVPRPREPWWPKAGF